MDKMDLHLKGEVLVCSVDHGEYSMAWYYTSPSYRDSACTIDGSDLEPSRNSSIDNLPSAFCCFEQNRFYLFTIENLRKYQGSNDKDWKKYFIVIGWEQPNLVLF